MIYPWSQYFKTLRSQYLFIFRQGQNYFFRPSHYLVSPWSHNVKCAWIICILVKFKNDPSFFFQVIMFHTCPICDHCSKIAIFSECSTQIPCFNTKVLVGLVGTFIMHVPYCCLGPQDLTYWMSHSSSSVGSNYPKAPFFVPLVPLVPTNSPYVPTDIYFLSAILLGIQLNSTKTPRHRKILLK